MKYQDYYAILGIGRGADSAAVKKAYLKLARKYHPDVSKLPDAEERFKGISEAYKTLKDPDKRAAYDQLGSHAAGQDFDPPQDWQQGFADGAAGFAESDLADLFASLRGGRSRARSDGRPAAMPGQDYEVAVHITLEQAFSGTEVELQLVMPDYDANGHLHRVPRTLQARIPKGATDGQRLRVAGKGGGGYGGGRAGDLYLGIVLHPHPLFRVSGHDLYLDLPLTPWEAVLGASVDVPTPSGTVRLKVPPATQAGRQLRLAKRGLPRPRADPGDLFAIVQIVVPGITTEHERALFQQLAEVSTYDPRAHFEFAGAQE